MAEPVPVECQAQCALEHRAVRAWRTLAGERAKCHRIQTLTGEGHERAVYRLVGVGHGGSDLVAKRSLSSAAAVEWLMYAEVLPQMPIRGLQCYGRVVDDEDHRYCWLFLEDAGDEGFVMERAEHRTLALTWLGSIHSAALQVRTATSLPKREANSYRELLRLSRQMTVRALEHPALLADELGTLRHVIAEADTLDAHWNAIAKVCERIPHTLVHGDFVDRNFRIRTNSARMSLWVLDWETAGWGIPAADLAECVNPLSPDAGVYTSAARDYWSCVDRSELVQLVKLGKMFRLIDGLVWSNQAFARWTHARVHVNSAKWYIDEMRLYGKRIAGWIRDDLRSVA